MKVQYVPSGIKKSKVKISKDKTYGNRKNQFVMISKIPRPYTMSKPFQWNICRHCVGPWPQCGIVFKNGTFVFHNSDKTELDFVVWNWSCQCV